jgi:hypothetical protein
MKPSSPHDEISHRLSFAAAKNPLLREQEFVCSRGPDDPATYYRYAHVTITLTKGVNML